MQIVLITLLIAAFIGLVYWLKTKSNENHYEDLEFVMLGIGDKKLRTFVTEPAWWQFWKKGLRTPGGARVKSTTKDVPLSALQDIDAGLQSQIDRYKRVFPSWNLHRNISDYDIDLIEPMGINQETEPGSPHLLVNGFKTAGTCLGVYPRTNIKRPKIVVPHQAHQNWQYREYFKNSVANESEHIKEYVHLNYDPKNLFWYYATAGDVHPHDIEQWLPVPTIQGLFNAHEANGLPCAFGHALHINFKDDIPQ